MKKYLLSFLIFAVIVLSIAGCGSSGGTSSTPTSSSYLDIVGFVYNDDAEFLISELINELGPDSISTVTDAVVKVNGTLCSPNENANYHPVGAFHLNEGDSVTVTINWKDYAITCQGVMPSTPIISSPEWGAFMRADQPVNITWNYGGQTPQFVWISELSEALPGNTSSYVIPANKYSPGSEAHIAMRTINQGTVTGIDADNCKILFQTDIQNLFFNYI